MTAEKNLDTSKQADKFADELLNDDELDNVAGGTGSGAADDNTSYEIPDSRKSRSEMMKCTSCK